MRDRLLSSTDAIGKLAAIPVVAQTVNALNLNGAARALMQKVVGVHQERKLPPYSPSRFRGVAPVSQPHAAKDSARTPGKVAIFVTCYVNYNEPGIGYDLIKLLDHNEIPYVIVEKEACCGMPKLELGDLDSVARLERINIPPLARLAREGYAILTAVPSCTLMFKSELPLLFAGDAEVEAVAAAMFDPFEYLVLRYKDGLLKTDFKQPLGKVSTIFPAIRGYRTWGRRHARRCSWCRRPR